MLHPSAALFDLSYKGLIRASGPDAHVFLQGQFGASIDELTPDLSQISSWNNAEGRVVTLLRLFYRDDHIYLGLAAGLKGLLLQKLSMHVQHYKVTLADAGDGVSTLGLIGQDAINLLDQTGFPAPVHGHTVANARGFQIVRLQGPLPRYVVYGSNDAVATLKKRWQQAATPGNEDLWALHKILAAEPTVYAETSEHFTAPMLDLDKTGGSAVKRHLARAESRTTVPLKPGAVIHTRDGYSPAAEVVDARRDAEGVWQMLVVVQDDFRDADLMHAASGAPVSLR